MSIYTPFFLGYYSFGLSKFHDPNWTGTEMYYEVKDCLRGRKGPDQMLYKTLKKGFLDFIGQYIFSIFVPEDIDSKDFQDNEHFLWFLDDLYSMLEFHGATLSKAGTVEAKRIIRTINEIYDRSSERYEAFLDTENSTTVLCRAYSLLYIDSKDILNKLSADYSTKFAERIFHDRELCEFLSNLLVTIGFDGWARDEVPCKWVDRKSWPSWTLPTITARDRGACAMCGANIAMELEANANIDHIVPLDKAGTNDIVNLQLLCETCNKKN